jgi:hypothetical protein
MSRIKLGHTGTVCGTGIQPGKVLFWCFALFSNDFYQIVTLTETHFVKEKEKKLKHFTINSQI